MYSDTFGCYFVRHDINVYRLLGVSPVYRLYGVYLVYTVRACVRLLVRACVSVRVFNTSHLTCV